MSMKMKSIEFSKPTYKEWQEEAIKALKGKPFESLFTKTLENITLQPLYTKEQLVEELGKQLDQQVATIRATTPKDRFATAQQIWGDSQETFITNLENSLARGNEWIVIDSRVPFDWNDDLYQIIADYMTEYPFKLIVQSKDDSLLNVLSKIDESKRTAVEGFISCSEQIDTEKFPNIRVNSGATIDYHGKGANAVQELAIALAEASELIGDGSFDQLEQKFFAQFAIDTHFFMEIAKIRAFKVLWKAFASAFEKEAKGVPVIAETSVRSFSKIDVYVNLLRTGNASLAAAISGIDAFTIHPHDVLTAPTEQSIRIARNVSLVTKEESHVLNVQDPAGGSYFVESLTAELVKEAWALFIAIEEAGGLTAYKAKLAEEIAAIQSERAQQVATRKISLIGTNIYANPDDVLPEQENEAFADIPRLAKPFEMLRKTYSKLQPNIAILTFGELKNYKPRADYVAGVLAVAGVKPTVIEGVQTIEEAKAALAATDATYVIVAATDDDTKAIVPILLNDKPKHVILDAAGRYKDEADTWVAQGLNGFVYAGQNIVEKLQQIAAALGEA